jgi:hypothetical protein
MPISIKFGTKHPWKKEIQNCSNKDSGPLERGGNYKKRVGIFKKKYSQEPQYQKSSDLHESFLT